MSSFPLLRTPYLVFKEIMQIMDFSDLIPLSFCSRRLFSAMKRSRIQLRDFKICAVIGEHTGIVLRNSAQELYILGVSPYFSASKTTISNFKLAEIKKIWFSIAINEERFLTSYWFNFYLGMKLAADYVTDLFNSELHTIQFPNRCASLMNWVNSPNQNPFAEVIYNAQTEYDEELQDLDYVLRNSTSESLEIRGYVPPDFEYVGGFGSFNKIFIKFGKWITFDNLMSLKCSKVFIRFARFNSFDINRLLKEWISGNLPHVEYMMIGITDRSPEEVYLEGLDDYVRRTDNKKKMKWGYDEFTWNGLELHRNDGMVASINRENGKWMFNIFVSKAGTTV